MTDEQYKQMREALLIYLAKRTNASMSQLPRLISLDYVYMADIPSCCLLYLPLKRDVEIVMKSLSDAGLVEFVGGHKWGITEEGKKVVNELPQIKRFMEKKQNAQ